MAAPRTKRQFAGAASDPAQRQIKDFFKPSPNGTSSPSDLASGPLSPPLPGQVQANLLSVGMRVRKSVPEGYKTPDKTGLFSLWTDASAPSDQPPARSSPLPSSSAPYTSAPPPQRELVPFCGIHKVGGLAVQPETQLPIPATYFTPSPLDRPAISVTPVPALDDLPGLTSSQDTVASAASLPSFPPQSSSSPQSSNTRKRTYAEEDIAAPDLPGEAAGYDIIWRHRHELLDGEVSPHSLRPAGWGKNARVMAVPRGAGGARKEQQQHYRGAAAAAAAAARQLDQENRVAVVRGADDFEEAEFLDYMEE